MAGQATFSLEDDDLAGADAGSDFLAADLSAEPLPFESLPFEPLPFDADSLEGVLAEESPDGLSLTAELEPFLESVR